MADINCENCGFRARYDTRPKSILGRIWRFHANWCPGWKKFMNSLPDHERIKTAQRYNIKKFL